MQISLIQSKQRILSIDILRGAVMLIMALDHVRDFFHNTAITADPTDMATTTPVLFFTRWVTHFCAPAFVFLSGVSAYIAGQRKTKAALSSFLIKRGLWLVFAEITIMTFALSFNPFFNIVFLNVIWAIGFSMIVLGLLTGTSMKVIVITGFILVFSHNIFDYIPLKEGTVGSILVNIFLNGSPSFYPAGSDRFIAVFYTVLPWTGVMLSGYALGTFYIQPDAAKRKQVLFLLGLSLTILFIVLRAFNFYGDPSPWSVQKDALYTFLSFINTTKYPPSLLFICMTLGPALMLLSVLEQSQNKLSRVLMVYGRVPFFYFVMHFYIIRALSIILFFATGYGVKDIADPAIPFLFRPATFGYDLWVVYLVCFFVIAILYKPCKWFDNYKRTHTQWWLSYV